LPDAPPLRLAFAIPWRDLGSWLWEFLPDDSAQGTLLFGAPEPGPDGPRSRRLPPYLAELAEFVRRRYRIADYDVVFAWELRSALAIALLRKGQGARRTTCFVAVGPILKGGILKALPLVRWLLADADRIVCFARAECDDYAQLLNLPRDRFVFLPTPWRGDEAPVDSDDGTILALGHSNRDYPTLLRAVAGTQLPLTIVASDPAAFGDTPVPENVTTKFNTGYHETNALIAGAGLHCIPLHDANHSAGQTVLLRTMARGKATVVTDTPGVRDYVVDNETAVLVPPGDPERLRAALQRLWADPAARRNIGARAAAAVREEFGFPRFTQRIVALAHEVAGR
jgi:glycosyltransferase involved in cell wall biosynthesis